MTAKKSLELNPSHPVMKSLLELLKESDGQLSDAQLEYVDLLYSMALLNSGFYIDEPTDFTTPLEKLIRVGFGVGRDEAVEEIEIEMEEEEVIVDEGSDEPEELVFDLNDEL